MEDYVNLYLSKTDVGQVLEELHERVLVWKATYEYLTSGQTQSADYIEECSHAHEAIAIVEYYEHIIRCIIAQIKEQNNNN